MSDDFTDHVTEFGQSAWAATGGRGLETWQGWRSSLNERLRRTEGTRLDLRLNGRQLKDALIELDLQESGRAWTELTGDARSAWQQFASEREETEAAAD